MDESIKRSDGHGAKSYQKIKQKLSLFHLVWTPALLCVLAFTPLSQHFFSMADGWTSHPMLQFAAYFFLFSMFFLILDLPFSFYSGYVLEHRYGLSNQKIGGWAAFFIKRSILSFLLSLILLEVLYFLIGRYEQNWWFIAWLGYAAVSIVMGKLFPVFIVPLFYKYDLIRDEALKQRIFSLAKRYGMPIENLYSINLSKTTKKANAAFMGFGKTKRVVLSDTLIENFTHDEIEAVLAHELGHFKNRDILRQLAFGMLASFASFWLAFQCLGHLSSAAGYRGAGDIAALPLLFLIFYLFGLILRPAQSGFSRMMERAADRFSLQAFPHPSIFISCMEKLGKINLADPDPNPVYEWFFYDHPSIGKRIAMAQSWKPAS